MTGKSKKERIDRGERDGSRKISWVRKRKMRQRSEFNKLNEKKGHLTIVNIFSLIFHSAF